MSDRRAPDGRTREELLALVLGQPETKTIAETLGLDVKDYAELVVHYKMNPDEEPQVEVLDDEAARAAGMPTVEECAEFLRKIQSGEVVTDEERARFAGFDTDERSAATLTGASAVKRAPARGEAQGRIDAADPALQNQVRAARDRVRQRTGKTKGK